MRQTKIFSHRNTTRPVNTLSAVDSLASSGQLLLQVKELTDVYKEEEVLLRQSLSIIRESIDSTSDQIRMESEDFIMKLKQQLREQVSDYNGFVNEQNTSLQHIRQDNLEHQKMMNVCIAKLEVAELQVGDQILQRKYDIKL